MATMFLFLTHIFAPMVAWLLFAPQLAGAHQRHQGNDCNPNTRLLRTFPYTTCIILSPDGFIVSASANYIQVWDVEAGIIIHQKPFNGNCSFLSSNRGGQRLFLKTTTKQVLTLSFPGLEVLSEYTEGDYKYVATTIESDDGSMIASVADKRVCITSWNTTSVHCWNMTAEATKTQASRVNICWSPSNLIVVLSLTAVSWYRPNGTLVLNKDILSMPMSLSCGPLTAIGGVMQGLFVLGEDGAIFRQTPPETVNDVMWSAHGNVLVSCGSICRIYDPYSLETLLNIEEALKHNVIGFSANEKLATVDMSSNANQQVMVWNVQIPLIRHVSLLAKLPVQNPYQMSLGWLDRDRILLHVDAFMEVNVRTMTVTRYPQLPAYLFPADLKANACGVGGAIYHLDGSGLMTVVSRGQIIRQWVTGLGLESPLSCSRTHIGVAQLNRVVIWNTMGVNATYILESALLSGKNLAVFNATTFAFGMEGGIYVWNPNTLQPVRIGDGVCHSWNGNGTWLLFFDSNVGSWKLYDNNNGAVVPGPHNEKSAASWSGQSNLLLLDTAAGAIIFSPEFGMTFHAGISGITLDWNVETMEVVATDKNGVIRVWSVMPTVRQLPSRSVGVASSVNVTMVGATFLPSPFKMMIRWLDSSTFVPQCMFVNADLVNEYMLRIKNLALPDPASYTAFLQVPTSNSISPWISSSDATFPGFCPGESQPILNTTGGLTTCICPSNLHAIPSTYDGLKCESCPPHGRCDGTPQVVSEVGYWAGSEHPIDFQPCPVGACLGRNECADWHEGPVCGLCQEGAGQHGFGRCKQCNTVGTDIALLMLGFLCWIGFCVIQSLFALGAGRRKSRNNSAQLAAVLVSTTQYNALLMSVDINFYELAHTLGYAEESTQSAGIQSAAVSCLIIHSGLNSEQVHYVKQLFLLLLPVLAWVILLMLRALVLRCGGIATSPNVVHVPIVVIWTSLQSALITSLFQTLECTKVNVQEFGYRISHDFSVSCYSKNYWLFVGCITIPAIIATTIVIPLATFRRLRTRSSLQFLVKSYRSNWWFLVVFYRKILFSAIVTFTRNPLYVGFSLLLTAVLQLVVWPSTAFCVNFAEILSMTISAFIFSVAGTLGNLTDPAAATYQSSAILLFVAGALSYVIQIRALVNDRWFQGPVLDEHKTALLRRISIQEREDDDDNQDYKRAVE